MPELPKELSAWLDLDRRILEENVRPRVTPEVVEEHRRSPRGKHGDDLDAVLRYLRRNRLEVAGKHIVVETRPDREWRIAELSGVRGVPPRIDESRSFASRDEAEHEIFLRRLRALGLWKE